MERTVLQEVAVLRRAPLDALRERWRGLFGAAPPAYSRAQMARRLAYRLQELRSGGLADGAASELAREVKACAKRQSTARKGKARTVAPGTVLVRHWRGERHEVTACRDGTFEYRGRRHKTLTAAAKAITGQHLSGPKFFGLPTAGKGVNR